MDPYEPTPWNHERQGQADELDRSLPSDAFREEVRQRVYKYALIRNSWGTTNIDAGPVELERVEELYEAYERGIAPSGGILPTEREVLNYFGLVRELPDAPASLDLDAVLDYHRAYFHDVPLQNDARAGAWKDFDNVVHGPYGTLRTVPKEETENAVADLLTWLEGDGADLPTLVRAGLFFHRFQVIHPFGDGNGRIGRFLTLYVLSTGGLDGIRYCPIDDTINEDRQEYYRTLHAADQGNRELWVNYFTAQVVTGYQRAHILARRLQHIPPSVPESSRRLLEWCYIHRVSEFQPKETDRFYLNDSRHTRARRLKELEELGLIQGRGRGAGRRYEVLALHAVETGEDEGGA